MPAVPKRVKTVLSLLVVLTSASPAFANGFRTIRPGEFVVQDQTVPVDVVLIGYDETQVDTARLGALLPATYRPVVRYPQFYGLAGRDVGLEFNFRYRVVRATRRFEDDFFRYLARTGVSGPLTPFQSAYNDQTRNVLDVAGPVLYIDAPSVERYLAWHGKASSRGYTIYLVNWYGRSDFRFHVYTKTDEVDPDTGYNFGVERGSRKLIAWGGSHSRTWFYDLSAGPEFWTNNWIVDDDQSQYHMPPVWEYVAGGYRAPAALSTDLGLVARFVAINLLFTASPLYDPLVTAPEAGGAKVAHVAMLEDDAGSSGLDFYNPSFTRSELRRFQPYYPWKAGTTDTNPIDAGAKRALDIFAENIFEDDCWTGFGFTFAQLFCYFDSNLSSYVPDYARRDYVGKVFAFNTTAASLNTQFGLLGFADDNWVDGTQSYVFTFGAAEYRSLGFGFTSTVVHEFGHHVGMSHPHDGYDSELDIDYGPFDFFEFAWSGDESRTVMHYLSLSNGFGQFDQDNAYRWEAAGYLNWTNAVVGDLLAHRGVNRVGLLLAAADWAATASVSAFNRWDYLTAAASARLAYSLASFAAGSIGASTPTLTAARQPLAERHHPKDGCYIRSPLQ
ncbi:MAG: hypothetical protein OEW19_07320 [Acidobacteriota bacterium]|nr:hypothetical protein [Acidobacteriota bacterium]